MHAAMVQRCPCPDCLRPDDHPTKEFHRQLNVLLSRLDEQQQRWLVALESQRLGYGGTRLLSLVTGLHIQTIRRGRRELANSLSDRPPGRVRRPGAGRPPKENKTPPGRGTCAPCWSMRPAATP